MSRNLKEKNLFPLILGVLSALALICLLVFPVGYIDRGYAEGGISGFAAIFGLTASIGNISFTFNSVNGWGLAIVCMLVLTGVFSGYLSKFGRGFYYASTVIAVLAIILIFMYHSNWLWANAPTTLVKGSLAIGAGQIIAAILMIFQALGNLVAAYQSKNI